MPSGNWIYQGRQYHQWFGHGTAPQSGQADASPELNTRIAVLGETALASFKQSERSHPALQPGQSWQAPFRQAMHAWVARRDLAPAPFAKAMFDRDPAAPGISDLHKAANTVATARTQRDMWAASDHLAAGMRA